MPSITTTELVKRAKAAADMHDSAVTPAQWMFWASQERMGLDLLLARSGWALNFGTSTITVAGTEAGEFTIGGGTPIAVMAIVAVHEVGTSGTRILQYSDTVSFLKQLPGTAVTTGHATSYRVKRDVDDSLVLNFFPNPTTGLVYIVTYVVHPLRLTLDASPATGYANTVNYPMGWEERIVLGMARRAVEKEESDSSSILRQLQGIDSEIEELCWSRVMSASPTIRNVDYETRGWGADMIYPPPMSWWWA